MILWGKKLTIESSAFKDKESIPKDYTCEGADLSPPLTIDNIPKETKSLALIVDDPDAGAGTFDHWVAWNLPPTTKVLEKGAHVPVEGMNGFGSTRYRGPCPPRGLPHRYFFKLFALDILLDLPEGSTKGAVLDAMKGHILGKAVLIGIYKRQS